MRIVAMTSIVPPSINKSCSMRNFLASSIDLMLDAADSASVGIFVDCRAPLTMVAFDAGDASSVVSGLGLLWPHTFCARFIGKGIVFGIWREYSYYYDQVLCSPSVHRKNFGVLQGCHVVSPQRKIVTWVMLAPWQMKSAMSAVHKLWWATALCIPTSWTRISVKYCGCGWMPGAWASACNSRNSWQSHIYSRISGPQSLADGH